MQIIHHVTGLTLTPSGGPGSDPSYVAALSLPPGASLDDCHVYASGPCEVEPGMVIRAEVPSVPGLEAGLADMGDGPVVVADYSGTAPLAGVTVTVVCYVPVP